MKLFNYIEREQVNPIDLNVLGQTYNTLEQGHKEAVRAASDLEVTMANLDLNEQEAEWRQQKIGEIRQTIAENTNHGNAYGALDDIISKAGNIASDQGMIGRLKAQQDYKKFNTELESRPDLPESYKDYYKENNPYYYEDKIDEKTGNIIGGTKWQPIATPSKVVPLNELMTQGLQWAAKESGGGNQTRWIDANGNVTADPSQAFDGQIFNETTSKWERLTKDKIWQGIRSSIASTPGAKESVDQDYKIATWQYEKQLKANGGEPIVSDVTDSNGVLLSADQYLFKRVDPMVQAASYNNSVTSTNYGSGLATYKAAKAQQQQQAAQSQQGMREATIDGRNTPVEVAVDAASNFMASKNNAAMGIKDIYKNITGRDLFIKEGGTIVNMEELLNKHDIPVHQRQQVRALTKVYNESVSNLNAFTKDMKPDDKAKFDFSARMKSGGELKSSKNGGSKYDDLAIKSINDLYGKGETLLVEFDNDEVRTEFENAVSGGQFKGYENLGVSIQGNQMRIPKDKMNSLPIIFNALEKARDQSNRGFLGTIAGGFRNRYNVNALDSEGNVVEGGKFDKDIGINILTYNKARAKALGDLYNKADKIGVEISDKYNIAPRNVQVSSLNLDGKNFTEGTLLDQFNKGIIDKQQYDVNKEYYNNSFDEILSNTDFSQTDMYFLEDGDNIKRKVVDSKDRFNYGSEILKAVKDKRITTSPSIVPGIVDPLSGAPISGYNITILPEKDSSDPVKRFYIPGMVNEVASSYMMQDPYVQSFNAVSVIGATKSSKALTDDNVNPRLGKITLKGLGQDKFDLNFNGIKMTLNQPEAVDIATAINNYNAVKATFLSNGGAELNPAMKSTIVNSATTIGNVLGVDRESVFQKLFDDINK